MGDESEKLEEEDDGGGFVDDKYRAMQLASPRWQVIVEDEMWRFRCGGAETIIWLARMSPGRLMN